MSERKPLVGVTGIIGSGKSTVSRLFAELGAAVFDADAAAHRVTSASVLLVRIRELFGDQVFADNGDLDRRRLAEVVFQKPEQLRQLNELVHPLVRQEMWDFVRQQQGVAACTMIVIDAPLIYETDLYKYLDFVVVVAAAEEECVRRVTQRAGLSPEEIKSRMAQQLPLSEKVQRADFRIDNDSSLEQLPAQVAKIYQKILQIWSGK